MATILHKNQFTRWHVPATQRAKTSIKTFLGDDFINGHAYYQLVKPEIIQAGKEVVAEEIATSAMVAGDDVRRALGLPVGAKTKASLNPEDYNEYRIFVQSTSSQRHVTPDTIILTKKEDDEIKPESPIAPVVPFASARVLRKRKAVAYVEEKAIELKPTKAVQKRKVVAEVKKEIIKPEPVKAEAEKPKAVRGGRKRKTNEDVIKPEPVEPVVVSAPNVVAPKPAVDPVPNNKKAKIDKVVPPRDPNASTQLVISFDTTGSMASCIARVKAVVNKTIQQLFEAVPNLEIAIIAHGDYCDTNSTYLMKSQDFTKNAASLVDFINKCGSTGGGDFPEAYEYVLHKARTNLSWRDTASKAMIMIGDATPHEPTYHLNTLKLDWRVEARLLNDANIKVYAVKCLAWNESKPFYKELAQLTNGYYLELHQFHAIPEFLLAISVCQGGAEDQLGVVRDEIRERNGGVLNRNLRQLFRALGADGEGGEDDDDSADLDAVAPGRFQVLDVPENVSIKQFVLSSGAQFKTGKGFYEFMKPEEIQSYKEIVLVNIASGDMFTGECAREKAGIPNHIPKLKVSPPPTDKWRMFIQLISANRVLVGGTKFLYEVAMV